jgi:hypothetical protein
VVHSGTLLILVHARFMTLFRHGSLFEHSPLVHSLIDGALSLAAWSRTASIATFYA